MPTYQFIISLMSKRSIFPSEQLTTAGFSLLVKYLAEGRLCERFGGYKTIN